MLFSETETAKQNQKFPFHFFFRFAAEGWGEEAREKCKEIFGFCTRESASVSEAHSFASPRNRSVRGSFKPPRAPRVRSGFAQRLIHHRKKQSPIGLSAYGVCNFKNRTSPHPLLFTTACHGDGVVRGKKVLWNTSETPVFIFRKKVVGGVLPHLHNIERFPFW